MPANLYVRISYEHDTLLRSVAEESRMTLREAVEMLIDFAVRPATVDRARTIAIRKVRAEVTS